MNRVETGPEHDGAHPFLVHPDARRPVEAVALVLHGGTERSLERTTKSDPAVLRMVLVLRSIARASRGRIAPVLLRNAVRGYNDDARSPVHDARWALQRVRELHPGAPVALVGHSMGGRTALELAGEQDVRSVAGMAPWIPTQYDLGPFEGRHVLLLHGARDRITDPRQSRRLVERLRAAGHDASGVQRTDWHAMMLQAPGWHHRMNRFLRGTMLT